MQGKECASAAINRLKTLNRRTVDVIAAKLYFFYSYIYELTDSLLDIRGWVFNSQYITNDLCNCCKNQT